MQEQSRHSAVGPGTQATGDRYTPEERATIERLARGSVRKRELVVLFPHRSPGSIKKQIVDARHRLGLIEPGPKFERRTDDSTTMLAPDAPHEYDDWPVRNRKAMTTGNARFLAALALL